MTTAATVADPLFLPQDNAAPDARVNRWRSRLFLLLLAGIACWAVVTYVVAPPIIRSGYENTSSIAAINDAFDHRDEHPLSHYMRKWNKLALAGLAAWVGTGLLILGTTSAAFARRIVGTATPGTLGAIRVLACLVLARAAYGEPITSIVKLGPGDRVTMGVMDLIYHDGAFGRGLPIGFDQLVQSESGLRVYRTITVTVLLLAALGWKSRAMMILGAILYLPLMGIVRSYSWFNHCGVVPFYILLVLIFTRSADGWSVDRLTRLWKGKPVPRSDVPTPYYAWARYAVWLVIVLPYVAAGMSKLTNNSWRWWEGINLQTILYTDALRPGTSGEDFILSLTWLPAWAFTIMGLMTIATELGMGLVLVSRVARMILPVMTVAMHVGIQLLQHILFWDLIVLQVMFYNWTKVRHWLGHRLAAKRGAVDVLYDGRCALCQRSVRLLRAWDLLERLNYLDFRTLDVAAYNAHRGVSLDVREMERAMHVVWRGRVTSGFEGCRTIAASLPIFWPVVPLLYLPGLSHLGAAAYRWLARNRMAFHTCDPAGDACAAPEHDQPRPPTPVQRAMRIPLSLTRKLAGPFVVTAIICFMLGAWAVRVEWYPFTSMQMFSTYRNSGVVTYYRTLMTDAWGQTYPAHLDKMGRGVSRYRHILSGGFFDAAGRARLIEMLQFCGEVHNAANPSNPVVKLEVEKRQWDFVNHRLDPNYGQAVDRIAVTFDAPQHSDAVARQE